METETALFKECYNYLVAHQYAKGCDAFLAAYQEHPREIAYFYGLLASLLLKSGFQAALEKLNAEKEISLYSPLLSGMYRFLKNNPGLAAATPVTIIYNLGLFIMKQVHYLDAKFFFGLCLVLEPAHTGALTATGEIALRERNYKQGLQCYIQAARQAAGQMQKHHHPHQE